MNATSIPRFLLLILFFLVGTYAISQKNVDSTKYFDYYQSTRFITNAPVVLPKLYKDNNIVAIKHFVDNWALSPAPSYEFIFVLRCLMDINSHSFSIHRLPTDFLHLLNDYSEEIKKAGDSLEDFKYYIDIPFSRYSYDATNDAKKLLLFTQSWAKNIINTTMLDSTASFLCHVFAADTKHPSSYFKSNKINYTEIRNFEDTVQAFKERCFKTTRNKGSGTASFLFGEWVPQGNLSTLGSHPSIGIQLGCRNKLNEYDVNWCFRFPQPTPTI